MELNDLMRLLDQGYQPEGTVAENGWDFSQRKLRPSGTGDDLAYFICAEVQDSYEPASTTLEQLKQVHADLTRAAEDLTRTAESIHTATVKFIAVSFWSWFRKAGRKTYSDALFSAWCDVHDEQMVRDLRPVVCSYLGQVIKGRALSDEVLASIDTELCGELLNKPTTPPATT